MPARALRVLVALALLTAAHAADAQRKTLRWRALDVTARLDARGDLHVSERHAIVFDGPWNGGERVFRVPRPQRLAFERLLREDPGRGLVELRRGSLDVVDRWAFVDDVTLRWRSRAPSDPEFQATELVYVLEYVLSNVLRPDAEGRHVLAHDFAFPARDGRIEAFTARLELDPSWEAEPGAPLVLERRALAPRESAVARVALRWVAAGPAPALATPGLPAGQRPALAVLLGALLAAAAVGVWRHDRARGLFSRAVDPSAIDAAWLRAHVLALPPEVVGAAWDGTIGAPEVAAVLARMAAEGKLEARVETTRGWLGTKEETLHLTLRVKRAELAGNERTLVDALFVAGNRIDSTTLRRHYEGEGFDPASEVRERIELAVARLVPEGDPPARWTYLPMGLFLVVGLALAIGELRDGDPALVVGSVFAGAMLSGLPFAAARLFAHRVERHAAPALAMLVPLALWAAAVQWLAVGGAELGPRAVLAHAALFAFAVLLVARRACTCTAAEGIAVRKRLAAARAHFARELRSDRPILEESWTPYLVALGLGPELDRWFRVHGAAGEPSAFAGAGGAPAGSAGTGWSGGGGAFSGGGASGTWAAFAALSSAIPSPSSGSSDGGGGSGGSSSGGGGGGGW